MKLYPLKFNPILKEMIWGGQQIPRQLGLNVKADTKIGECFALSGLKSDTSIVSNGAYAGLSLTELIDTYKEQLVGEKIYQDFGSVFPLLLKNIDANDDLSIQVHPNDMQAKLKHNSFGKTEMWYVVDAKEGACLISGFTKPTNSHEFQDYYHSGRLMDLMSTHQTNEGDTFFIPAGKVHSIGKGNLIAEIQQTSDITYRIYDFDRKDKNGNTRELHHELAMDAINFKDDHSGKVNYVTGRQVVEELASCQYFKTNLLVTSQKQIKDYSAIKSFVVLMNVGGKCQVYIGDEKVALGTMETILIPAVIDTITIFPNGEVKILEVTV